ncbi:MAG: putative transport system permease protein, partial [Pseudonocardiales bacterium]|nr:putative transport system permease protein [Pseudonocardiales bacterium]
MAVPGMTVVSGWLRLEVRRRWRSLAALTLLVALSSAVVMTSLAAARRGASTLERLHDRTLPATVGVLANHPGFDWGPIEALPDVAALNRFVVDYLISIDGVSGDALGFPPADAALGRTIEKPVVFAGRLFDPNRADEAVVTRKFVTHYHKGVGDTVLLRLPTAKQLDDSFTGETPKNLAGPVLSVRIVGVVVSPWMSDTPDSHGGIQISPGVAAKYPRMVYGDPAAPDNLQFVNALVRLKGASSTDIARFNDELKRVTGRSDIDMLNLVDQQRQIQRDIAFESKCLVAFGIAAFVAALFLVGQAIARYAAASTTELHTLRALGMTPAQTATTAAAAPAFVGLFGAVLGAVLSFVASRWFPFGTAKLFEPTPGPHADWTVAVLGVLLVVALVVAGAATAARLAAMAARRAASSRRSQVAIAVGKAGAPVPVVIGARFALESGRGRTAVPVRPALIGAVTGVLGVVAAYTFSHGVGDAAGHPERFGQTFQLAIFAGINGQDFGPVQQVADALLAHPDVAAVNDSRTAVATDSSGRATVSLWEYRRSSKPTPTVVLDGRMPVAQDEVLLAPQTIASLHAHVGGTVTLTGTTKIPRKLVVTGSGLVPEGPHNGYADGGWIASSGFDSLFNGFKFHLLLITVPPGRDVDAATAALTTAITTALPGIGKPDIERGQLPTEVAEIREVRTLPIVLGGFLALLAVGAVGHALATAVRRRSHDLAVLRALGMTQWQCRWVVLTQATVLAVVGLVAGVPIGLALGRTIWRV